MKALILYRQNSEYARRVEEFLYMFNRMHPEKKTEVLDLDTREGSTIAAMYDIMQYPAVIAVRDDGSPSNIWQGEQLPLMDELAGHI